MNLSFVCTIIILLVVTVIAITFISLYATKSCPKITAESCANLCPNCVPVNANSCANLCPKCADITSESCANVCPKSVQNSAVPTQATVNTSGAQMA